MKKTYAWVIGLILLSFVTVGIFLTVAPDQIPVHYNARGEIDRWGSKYEFLLFPALTAFSGILMLLVGGYTRKKGEVQNGRIVDGMNIWMLLLFNGMWIFFLFKALEGTDMTGKLTELGAKGLLIMVLAVFIPVGNLMPKVQRNSLLGLRTKWSMADDVCWQKSQRFGGFLLVVTGIVGVAMVALLPADWGGYAMLALIVSMTVATVVGSYCIYKKVHPSERTLLNDETT